MRGQGRVALSPSAYKYRGSAEGKKKERGGELERFCLKEKVRETERETDNY
jgi:hypothetical protein